MSPVDVYISVSIFVPDEAAQLWQLSSAMISRSFVILFCFVPGEAKSFRPSPKLTVMTGSNIRFKILPTMTRHGVTEGLD